ncbi:MAG TPA: hypothetical protein VMU50_14815 [Polyangia bacterium]|nr:hypothetical protein [Polyangia bacterium]
MSADEAAVLAMLEQRLHEDRRGDRLARQLRRSLGARRGPARS